MMTTAEMIIYDEMVELGIATPDELNLCWQISNKTWSEVFDAIIHVRCGYGTWEAFLADLMEDEAELP